MAEAKQPQDNSVLQNSDIQPAPGQDATDFGAGGQDAVSTGAQEQRDVNRDAKLDKTGQDARTGHH